MTVKFPVHPWLLGLFRDSLYPPRLGLRVTFPATCLHVLHTKTTARAYVGISPPLGVRQRLGCHLLHLYVSNTPKPPAGCGTCPCCEAKHPSEHFPAWTQLQALQRLFEDVGFSEPGQGKLFPKVGEGLLSVTYPPSPSPPGRGQSSG